MIQYNYLLRLVFLLQGLLYNYSYCGFKTDTLIATAQGPAFIQTLRCGSQVIVFDALNKSFKKTALDAVVKALYRETILLVTDQGEVQVSPDQVLCCTRPNEEMRFCCAKDIVPGTILWSTTAFRQVRCLKKLRLEQPTTFYELFVNDPHLFFAGSMQILAATFKLAHDCTSISCVCSKRHQVLQKKKTTPSHVKNSGVEQGKKELEQPKKTAAEIKKELQMAYNNATTDDERVIAARALLNHIIPVNRAIIEQQLKEKEAYDKIITSRFSAAGRNDPLYRAILVRIVQAQTENDWVRTLLNRAIKAQIENAKKTKNVSVIPGAVKKVQL